MYVEKPDNAEELADDLMIENDEIVKVIIHDFINELVEHDIDLISLNSEKREAIVNILFAAKFAAALQRAYDRQRDPENPIGFFERGE